jgi:2-polyprenyl-3-methyl-5-hydroxy-6-metoxy-1,4-benzoquinol methylase
MSSTSTSSRSDALVERLFSATIDALELHAVYLGTELGLYAALADHGPLTAPELARTAGIAPRYAREWLEQQAVAGVLDVDDPHGTLGADERRFSIDDEHARVLTQPDDPAHVAPFAHLLAGIGQALPLVVQAYRTGEGVPYEQYGRDFRHGQGHINRPAFTHALPAEWLEAMPDVVERLNAGGARVADVGCGQGWSTIAVAGAYPAADVVGIDLDEPSIAEARAHAAAAGVDASFVVTDAARLAEHGRFDLVLVLEALHDLARPAEFLAATRAALAPGGVLLVVDEKVADRFTAPGDEAERMMYGWSVLHCLPTQLVEEPSAALGTVMRADSVRALAADAGFASCEELPVDGDLFRLYRLDA